jgi:hypothetical protein
MIAGVIAGHTRVLGKSQGYRGLAIRDDVVPETVNGPATTIMQSAWLPTPEEMARIAAGAPIILLVMGTSHPPVFVEVGDPPVNTLPEEAMK